ncbi:MAG: hypothetical protein GY796_03780, partial [Chloroflexi bacterium]|nr:hypothetical protein [Chloroflexota bacterium]
QGPIRVRILHVGDPVTIDGIWLRAQLAAAAARRTPLLQTNSIGHALDHPITFREGAYLKCLFASVP